jgi:hypothetical protein
MQRNALLIAAAEAVCLADKAGHKIIRAVEKVMTRP